MLNWSEKFREMMGSPVEALAQCNQQWTQPRPVVCLSLVEGGPANLSSCETFQSCYREYYLQFPMINQSHLLL